MRKRTCVALVGLLMTATGCKLTLPGGFPLVPVTPTGSATPGEDPRPTDVSCTDRFAKYDKNKDKALTLAEYLAKGGEKGDRSEKDDDAQHFLALDEDGDRKLSPDEYAAGCRDAGPVPPEPTSPIATAPPPRPGTGCEEVFAKYDGDQSGAWDIGEFMDWDGSRPRPASACVDGGPGGMVMPNDNGGGLIAGQEAGVVSSRGLRQVGDAGVSSGNDGGGLIGKDGGGVVSPFPGGIMAPPMPFPCPPDDPKFRFSQLDHDNDGQISAREFCAGPVKRPPPFPRPSGGPEPYPVETPGPGGCEDGFFRSDRDGDGLVSPEEFRASFITPDVIYANNGTRGEWVSAPAIDHMAIFKEQDRDQDGWLSLEESCGFVPPMPDETPPPADWCGFYKIDADNDGQATWEEFAGWSVRNEFPAPTKDVIYTRFAERDFDQNWVITQDEYCDFGQVEPQPYPYPSPEPTAWATPTPAPPTAGNCFDTFLKAGGSPERAISFEAYAKARLDQVRWFQAPSDEEVKRMMESYMSEARAYDRNKDGMLSYEEAKALCANQGN